MMTLNLATETKTRRSNRTDIHSPKSIIPANYRCVVNYALPSVCDGVAVPAINMEVVVELQRTQKFFHKGGPGSCSICGARFNYGDVWVHEPTQEHIHVGHDCADKYRLLTDRSAYELELGRARKAAAAAMTKAQNAEIKQSFLESHPGLEDALKTDHYIVADIASRFNQHHVLSEKQVDLVMKLAAEARAPVAEEKHVQAPVSDKRVTFAGTVVSAKMVDSQFGESYKMTVKVETEEGSWMAWGTIPANIMDDLYKVNGNNIVKYLKGHKVEVTAKLKAGRDPYFAIMNRPVGKLLPASQGDVCSN